MIKRMIIMLAFVGAIGGGLYWFVGFRANIIKNVLAGMANPVQTVSTVVATTQDWQSKLTAVGTFKAVNGADLSLEAAGIVDQVHFKSGDVVPAGQLLLELRKDSDKAKLDSLKATADLYGITLARDEEQIKAHAISQATVDSDTANLKSEQAQVAQQEAIIAQKDLKAPFAGRLGISSVDLGQYISAGTTVVTLQALDPIYVDFTLPQRVYANIKNGQTITANVDAYPGTPFEGKISAINAKVDSSSRNIEVRATLANPDHKLLPGMYAAVDITVGNIERFVTLPQTAIVYNSYGTSIFLVEKATGDTTGKGTDLMVSQHFVTTGASRGDQVAITSGVKDTDTVVSAGQLKLRNGTLVKVDNSIQPTSDIDPKPVDK